MPKGVEVQFPAMNRPFEISFSRKVGLFSIGAKGVWSDFLDKHFYFSNGRKY
jgi:hypothetical protein